MKMKTVLLSVFCLLLAADSIVSQQPSGCPAVDLCALVSCPTSTHCEVRQPILANGSAPCTPAGSATCCAFTICESNQKNNPCHGISCPQPSFCHVGTGGKPKCVRIPPMARYAHYAD